MTQRTCNIIMCCKGNCKWHYLDNTLDVIARYMSNECGADLDTYTPDVLKSIILTALLDYIDSADKPSYVIWSIINDGCMHVSIEEKICAMFCDVRVMDRDSITGDYYYVNGFTQDLISQSHVDLD